MKIWDYYLIFPTYFLHADLKAVETRQQALDGMSATAAIAAGGESIMKVASACTLYVSRRNL